MTDAPESFENAAVDDVPPTFCELVNDAAFAPVNRRADAILAMPEMQAIKLALQNVAEDDRYAFGGITDATQALTDRGLPECVVAWVLT